MDRRGGHIRSCGDAVQQGQGTPTCSSAPEHGTPPAHQRRVLALGAILTCHGLSLRPSFSRNGLSRQKIVLPLLSRGLPAWPCLLPPRALGGASLCVCGLAPAMHRFLWHTWALQLLPASRDTREWYQQRAVRPGARTSAINDHFESPLVHVVEHGQIEIANEDIRSDPCACFSADSCCHVLQWKYTTTQHARNWTRRPLVAQAVKETATPARANSEG